MSDTLAAPAAAGGRGSRRIAWWVAGLTVIAGVIGIVLWLSQPGPPFHMPPEQSTAELQSLLYDMKMNNSVLTVRQPTIDYDADPDPDQIRMQLAIHYNWFQPDDAVTLARAFLAFMHARYPKLTLNRDTLLIDRLGRVPGREEFKTYRAGWDKIDAQWAAQFVPSVFSWEGIAAVVVFFSVPLAVWLWIGFSRASDKYSIRSSYVSVDGFKGAGVIRDFAGRHDTSLWVAADADLIQALHDSHKVNPRDYEAILRAGETDPNAMREMALTALSSIGHDLLAFRLRRLMNGGKWNTYRACHNHHGPQRQLNLLIRRVGRAKEADIVARLDKVYTKEHLLIDETRKILSEHGMDLMATPAIERAGSGKETVVAIRQIYFGLWSVLDASGPRRVKNWQQGGLTGQRVVGDPGFPMPKQQFTPKGEHGSTEYVDLRSKGFVEE